MVKRRSIFTQRHEIINEKSNIIDQEILTFKVRVLCQISSVTPQAKELIQDASVSPVQLYQCL